MYRLFLRRVEVRLGRLHNQVNGLLPFFRPDNVQRPISLLTLLLPFRTSRNMAL